MSSVPILPAPSWSFIQDPCALSRAFLEVGKTYAFGYGVAKDEKRALEWFHQALEQGLKAMHRDPSPECCEVVSRVFHMLGTCYSEGKGISSNEAAGMAYFSAAMALNPLCCAGEEEETGLNAIKVTTDGECSDESDGKSIIDVHMKGE